jgi:chromodomain-helicase-DNA-binding protein 1
MILLFDWLADVLVFSPSMDEAVTKEELRPVKKQLKQLKLSGGDMPRDEKVAILKESLGDIGRRIEHVLNTKREAGEDVERWRKHLWAFVTLFWPKKVRASKLQDIHAKMVQKEKPVPAAGSGSGSGTGGGGSGSVGPTAVDKKRPSMGSKGSGGGGGTPRSNGKMVR